MLGWEQGQLNGPFVYPGERLANQLFTLSSIGVFANPPDDVAAVEAYPPPDLASADVSARGATYLHVNCAMCHQPNGGGQSDADFRLSTGLAGANVCDAVPEEGDFGVADARVFAPGDPARSMISVRMRRLQSGRMPLLGSTVVDEVGVDVVDHYSTATTTCP